nr:hypothetical protein [uncultured Brumimicrobium sp.]
MRYLFIILSCFIWVSCKKETSVIVTTINKVTGQPIAGVTIFATEDLSWDPINKAKGAFFEGITDQNGKLVINFKMRNNGKYQLIQQIDGDGSCWHNTKAIFLEYEKNQNVLFEFAPCAQLKLKIDNVNCQGPGDKMQFRRLLLGTPFGTWSTEREGCYFFESPGYFDVPMGWIVYEWKGIQGGIEFYYIDSIYLNESENGSIELNY